MWVGCRGALHIRNYQGGLQAPMFSTAPPSYQRNPPTHSTDPFAVLTGSQLAQRFWALTAAHKWTHEQQIVAVLTWSFWFLFMFGKANIMNIQSKALLKQCLSSNPWSMTWTGGKSGPCTQGNESMTGTNGDQQTSRVSQEADTARKGDLNRLT